MGAHGPNTVGVVYHEPHTELGGQVTQTGNVSQVSLHAEDAVGDDHAGLTSVGFQHVAQAVKEWGSDFQVVCTGGDGRFVSSAAGNALFDEDLVFKGLAIACPFVGGV